METGYRGCLNLLPRRTASAMPVRASSKIERGLHHRCITIAAATRATAIVKTTWEKQYIDRPYPRRDAIYGVRASSRVSHISFIALTGLHTKRRRLIFLYVRAPLPLFPPSAPEMRRAQQNIRQRRQRYCQRDHEQRRLRSTAHPYGEGHTHQQRANQSLRHDEHGIAAAVEITGEREHQTG